MIDQAVFREAIELADGWEVEWEAMKPTDVTHVRIPNGPTFLLEDHKARKIPQWVYDALAAQLLSQVEAAGYLVWGYPTCILITDDNRNIYGRVDEPQSRTKRRILVAVKSGVLKK